MAVGPDVPSHSVLEGEVLTTENLGVSALVTVDVGPLHRAHRACPSTTEPQVGERLRLRPQEQRLLLYRVRRRGPADRAVSPVATAGDRSWRGRLDPR